MSKTSSAHTPQGVSASETIVVTLGYTSFLRRPTNVVLSKPAGKVNTGWVVTKGVKHLPHRVKVALDTKNVLVGVSVQNPSNITAGDLVRVQRTGLNGNEPPSWQVLGVAASYTVHN